MNINKEYWDTFYQKDIVSKKETDFAIYVLRYVNNLEGNKIIDIACGNARDTIFFSNNDLEVSALDMSSSPLLSCEVDFHRENMINFDYEKYDFLYLRFVVHSLVEDDLDIFLNNLSKLNNKYIFIETRSTRGISDREKKETYFKSSLGDEHFRMLYSKDYLDNKLLTYFEIMESSEGRFSPYGDDNPYCLRYVLKNK